MRAVILAQAGPHEGSMDTVADPDHVHPVPEPATYGFWLVGIALGLVLWNRVLCHLKRRTDRA